MKRIIDELTSTNNLRSLNVSETVQKYIINGNKQYLNLSSNDYLGVSSTDLQEKFINECSLFSSFVMSNPSSRLMTGNSPHYQRLENEVATLYNKEAALVFNCGFMLNSGVLPAITTSEDYIIADKLVHASIIDGIRLCDCSFTRFRHNDMAHLRKILASSNIKGQIYVVAESIYSMDGDEVALAELLELKEEFGFKLYLDEAHAFGVVGERGLGVAEKLGVIDNIDYLIVTLGKAAASSGAFVVCDKLSREVIINRARTMIFTTALPPITLMWSSFVIKEMVQMNERREHLQRLNMLMSEVIESVTGKSLSSSHIQPIIVGGNSETLALASRLKESGYWVTAVRYPTVAKGSARLRISLNASMCEEDIIEFGRVLALNYMKDEIL